MSQELVLVFFSSSDQIGWEPIEREAIPEWMRNESVIERLIKGECVRNVEAENRAGMKWYTAMAIDRKQPNRSQLILPERMLLVP